MSHIIAANAVEFKDPIDDLMRSIGLKLNDDVTWELVKNPSNGSPRYLRVKSRGQALELYPHELRDPQGQQTVKQWLSENAKSLQPSVALKSLWIDPRFDSPTRAKVELAQTALERILGEKARQIDVRWDKGETRVEHDPKAKLTLTDAEFRASEEFSLGELAETWELRTQLRRVWRRLLDDQFNTLRQQVARSLAADEGG